MKKTCRRCGGRGTLETRKFRDFHERRAEAVKFLKKNPSLWRGKSFSWESAGGKAGTPWRDVMEALKGQGIYSQTTYAPDVRVDHIIESVLASEGRR